jgi:hypothetical protein
MEERPIRHSQSNHGDCIAGCHAGLISIIAFIVIVKQSVEEKEHLVRVNENSNSIKTNKRN